MKAGPYHPGCQRYVGNDPRTVGANAVRGKVKEVVNAIEDVPDWV